MEANREDVNLNGEDMEVGHAQEGVMVEQELNGTADPELGMLLWMLHRDLFGLDEGEGRDIVIAASDGTQFVAHTSKLHRLFGQMNLKGEQLRICVDDVNFHFWEDGPTTKALLAFLTTNDRTLMEESSHVTFQLVMLSQYYNLEDVTAAAVQILTEKIGTKAEFKDPGFLWDLNAWIVSLTDKNNGEVPPELVGLKVVIAKVFNRNVTNSRKRKIRSPAANQNMFGSYWQMNVNFLL